MENHQQRGGASLMLTGTLVKQWSPDTSSLDECRDLVHLLANKTEALYRECRFDREKATHVRAIGSTLAALTAVVNRLENDSKTCQDPQILEDSHGVTYESVRSCDLDRICDK
jgi:hypothetical protein